MIVAISIDSKLASQRLDFCEGPYMPELDLNKVLYHMTVRKLYYLSESIELEGIIIPGSSKSVEYNVEYLIKHIRCDIDEIFSRTPIVVQVDSVEEYVHLTDPDVRGFNEEKLAVVVTEAPKLSDFNQIDFEKLEIYRKQATAKPLYSVSAVMTKQMLGEPIW